MAIFNSYVKLPEGNYILPTGLQLSYLMEVQWATTTKKGYLGRIFEGGVIPF
jgi:hypothetical protein